MSLIIVIPAILTFLFGLLFWIITRRKLVLTYDLIESDIFPSNLKKGKYYILKIKNKGNKRIEEINVRLDFKSGFISMPSISDRELVKNEICKNFEYSCEIPNLNPKEKIQITITNESENQFDNPNVNIRAKGVNGRKEEEKDYYSILSSFVFPILVAVLMMFFGYLFLKTMTHTTEKDNKELEKAQDADLKYYRDILHERDSVRKLEVQGNPEQQEIIFSKLNISGLTNLIPEIIRNIDEISYKNTGYLLFSHYLRDKSHKNKYIQALSSLNEEDMAPSSRGVILYLLYKIYKIENDEYNAQKAIDECKINAPLMEKQLIENDKYFDLESFAKGFK